MGAHQKIEAIPEHFGERLVIIRCNSLNREQLDDVVTGDVDAWQHRVEELLEVLRIATPVEIW